MMNSTDEPTFRYTLGVGLSTAALMILTAIHHWYGAMIYETPWRNHVAGISFWSVLLISSALFVAYRFHSSIIGSLAHRTAVAAVLLIPIGWIWLFESIYSHLLKNVLYFAGTPKSILRSFFPLPWYHMPNNFVFESTGLLQVIVGIILVYYTYHFILLSKEEKYA